MKKNITLVAFAAFSIVASAQRLMLVDGIVKEMPQQKQNNSRELQLEQEQKAHEQEMQTCIQQMRAPQYVRSNTKRTYVEKFDKFECETYRTINEYAGNGDYVSTRSVKVDGAWSNSYKEDYTFDENGNTKTYAYYRWSDNIWVPDYRIEYLQYDDNANCTHRSYYNWRNEDWGLSQENEYEFYENGQAHWSVFKNYADDGIVTLIDKSEYYESGKRKYWYNYWNDGYTIEEGYDENGNKTTWTQRLYDFESSNVCLTKHNTTYNEKNLETLDMLYMWNATEWQLVGKTEYLYDNKDRLTEKFYYEKDGDSWTMTSGPAYMWEDGTISSTREITTYKYEYTKYENESHELEEKCNAYYYNNGSWKWDNGSSYTKKYNAKNQIVLEENSWYKYAYEYDAHGNLLSEYRYTKGTSQWEADTKKLYTYDENGNKNRYELWKWDGDLYEWILNEYEEYVRSLLTVECSMFDEYNGYKYEYTFDENDVLRSEISYKCADGLWSPHQKYEYTDYYYSLKNPSKWYDSNYWEYIDGEWILGMYKDSKYDDRGNVLESTSYTKWEGYWHRVYTYDYNVDPAQIWGWSAAQKILSIEETNLETNEVNHVKFYYTPVGKESVQSVKCDTTDTQVIYDIAGRRMNNLQKGLNIVNQKKVIVK